MIDLIQIYKAKEVFTKSTYTPENRKLFNDLEVSVDSTKGYLDNDILFLPIEYKNLPEIKTADLIILQDVIGWESSIVNKCFDRLDVPDWFKKSRRDFLKN